MNIFVKYFPPFCWKSTKFYFFFIFSLLFCVWKTRWSNCG